MLFRNTFPVALGAHNGRHSRKLTVPSEQVTGEGGTSELVPPACPRVSPSEHAPQSAFPVALATARPRPPVFCGKRSGRSAWSGDGTDRELSVVQVGLPSGRVARAGRRPGPAEVSLRASAACGVPLGERLEWSGA